MNLKHKILLILPENSSVRFVGFFFNNYVYEFDLSTGHRILISAKDKEMRVSFRWRIYCISGKVFAGNKFNSKEKYGGNHVFFIKFLNSVKFLKYSIVSK